MSATRQIVAPLFLIALALVGYQFLAPRAFTAEVAFDFSGLSIGAKPELYFEDPQFVAEVFQNPIVRNSPWGRHAGDLNAALRKAITCQADPDSTVVHMTFTISHRQDVHILADAVADTFVEYHRRKQEIEREERLKPFKFTRDNAETKLSIAHQAMEKAQEYSGERNELLMKEKAKANALSRLLNELNYERMAIAAIFHPEETLAVAPQTKPAAAELEKLTAEMAAIDNRILKVRREIDQTMHAIRTIDQKIADYGETVQHVKLVRAAYESAVAAYDTQYAELNRLPTPVTLIRRATPGWRSR
jgi:hypothetical protein